MSPGTAAGAPALAAGLAKCSTIDFPGTLACVVFFRGCDLDCFYCHNRQLLTAAPAPEDIPWEEILDFLRRRQGMLEGVVFSGGEPTLRPQLPRWMEEVRRMGYRIKLDTNGQRPDTVRRLAEAGLTDYTAVDWKAPAGAWREVCGGSREKARETILGLLERGTPMEARTTLYPGLKGEELLEMAADLPPLPRWRLNLFRPPALIRAGDEELLRRPALGPAQLALLEGPLRKLQPGVILPKG